ncbi:MULTISPECIES: NAD(P)/FAD-dependent oxidoreductase [Anaerostipes]|mgnify:FL=1|uniref:FAD-dependent oxidoreductase n=1 Tax=Anaerostipes butyraticus TaxID=645466 RepID=A0A916Q536_9FIRM|nr:MULTISPECIES: FAD-binding oxidoreductase [Anaerostipes]GFO84568.1 FAD-dependent oxidoreductase [Anaerostipes butyraticus]HJC83613.1 FAD-binding oxidoreductase [Candidatus Anaerostipes avicola]
MKKTAEVIIIGGGVNGCAAAYYLAKRGVKDVIVLEASESIGHGGSSRNGGGVRQSGRDPRELPYAMYAVQNMWPTLSEELGVDVEYKQAGNLRLGKTQAHMEKLARLAENARKAGVDVRMIDGKEVKEICPYLSDDIIGASWCPTDGHANPMLTTLAYFKRAVELGVSFVKKAPVKAIKKVKGRARKVITVDGTVFEGETIILAAGYESREIARTVGIDIPMTRYFEEALVTEMQPPMFEQMLGTADADFYGHQTVHGSFVFGSESGLEEAADMEPADLRTSALTMSAGCRAIIGYIPALKDAKIVRSWGGWLDMCIDEVPVISPVEEVPGLILACAFTGHGFGTAPSVGLMLSQMVVGEETVVDIHSLRYDRFKADR